MFEHYLVAPAFNALFITAFILFIIVLLLVINFKSFINLSYYKQIALLASLSIAFCSHGLIQMNIENRYKFNPYTWLDKQIYT
jgi:hypothetical protein